MGTRAAADARCARSPGPARGGSSEVPVLPCCSEESYTVMNYATLDQVSVEKVEAAEPPSPPPAKAGGHLLRVVLERDSEGRREEVLLAADTL